MICLPKSVICEIVTTSVDGCSLLGLHKVEKLILDGKDDDITLEIILTVSQTNLYIPFIKKLVRTDRDNNFYNHYATNVGEP